MIHALKSKTVTIAIIAMMVLSSLSLVRAAEISTAKLYYYYPDDQSVDIVGSGFSPGSIVTISIDIIESDIHITDIVISDANGAFIYTYSLDGTPYTYVVTAIDSDGNLATTTFYDANTKFSVTITPDTVTTSQTSTYTLTIKAGSPDSVYSIGSVLISFEDPSWWSTPTSISITPAGGQSWSTGTGTNAPSAGIFKIYANTASDIIPVTTSGNNILTISFSITAPSTNNANYHVYVTTYINNNWSGNSGSDGTQSIRVEDPPSLSYVASSLAPISVSAGETGVAFSVNIANGGGVRTGVTLGTSSTFSFTDGTHTYTANLASDTTIGKGGGSNTLTFVATDIPSAMQAGSYTPTLHLVAVGGVDDNGASFGPVNPLVTPVALPNEVTVTLPTPTNTAPIVDAGAATATINEGDTFTRSGSFTDPDADSWTATVNYGDGSGTQGLSLTGKTFTLSHTYADNNPLPTNTPYTVTVTVDDGHTTGSDTVLVTVNNVAPSVTAPSDTSGDEGSSISIGDFTFTDPGTLDTHTAKINYGDGGSDVNLGTVTSPISGLSHTYADNGDYSVTVTVTDNDGDSGSATMKVTVYNVAPSVGAITILPTNPVIQVGSSVSASASYTDPGIKDTEEAEWDWGDGITSAGTVTYTSDSGGSGSIGPDSHTYTSPGVYTVKLTVTDKDGDSGTSTYQFVVVFDPNGGFVTGGGWIYSPKGALIGSDAEGKATFGFESKYQKGATVPKGNTEFQFHAGDLNFKSTSYEWLVVAGTKAMYKGVGTINGEGNYGFLLSAIDGGSKGQDTFRIQIWDKTNGDATVYDNMIGKATDADPTTIISGSIVVHK